KGGEALRPYPGDALLALLSALLLVLSFAHSVDAGPGDLDPSFGTGGRVLTDFGGGDGARALALQADGRIVVAGSSSAGAFGGGDGAGAGALQAAGRIVAAGFTSADFGARRRFALARYNPDGSLDPSFRGGRVVTSFADRDEASALALQSDGKIVVAGFSD